MQLPCPRLVLVPVPVPVPESRVLPDIAICCVFAVVVAIVVLLVLGPRVQLERGVGGHVAFTK